MKRIVKQVAGIDVAQKELVVCIGRIDEELEIELYAHKTFANTQKGFTALTEWINRHTAKENSLRFVMEATGVTEWMRNWRTAKENSLRFVMEATGVYHKNYLYV